MKSVEGSLFGVELITQSVHVQVGIASNFGKFGNA